MFFVVLLPQSFCIGLKSKFSFRISWRIISACSSSTHSCFIIALFLLVVPFASFVSSFSIISLGSVVVIAFHFKILFSSCTENISQKYSNHCEIKSLYFSIFL